MFQCLKTLHHNSRKTLRGSFKVERQDANKNTKKRKSTKLTPVQNGLFYQGILKDRAEKKNYAWFGVENGIPFPNGL